jgi:hypothetical protein
MFSVRPTAFLHRPLLPVPFSGSRPAFIPRFSPIPLHPIRWKSAAASPVNPLKVTQVAQSWRIAPSQKDDSSMPLIRQPAVMKCLLGASRAEANTIFSDLIKGTYPEVIFPPDTVAKQKPNLEKYFEELKRRKVIVYVRAVLSGDFPASLPIRHLKHPHIRQVGELREMQNNPKTRVYQIILQEVPLSEENITTVLAEQLSNMSPFHCLAVTYVNPHSFS